MDARELVQALAVGVAVAHGGNLEAVGLHAQAVAGEVVQFLLARDAQKIVLRYENLCLAQVGEVLQVLEVVQAVLLQVEPLRHVALGENLRPERDARVRVTVGEPAAVPFQADGAYLHGVRGDFPHSLRKRGPFLFGEEIVADFERVACPDVDGHGVRCVRLYCGEDFGADKADQEFFVARGHAVNIGISWGNSGSLFSSSPA